MNTHTKSLDINQLIISKKIKNKISTLKSPDLIQSYINLLHFNFEEKGETYMSPKRSIESSSAHCFEGALIAALALWVHGESPLLMDLKTTKDDIDHVVALFNRDGYWGAISKTNHSVLRYREPVYKTVRELAMSYFHEYFLNNGEKTLRSFSKPFNLKKYGTSWITTDDDLYNIVRDIDNSPHIEIISKYQSKFLRKADLIERKSGIITEWKR